MGGKFTTLVTREWSSYKDVHEWGPGALHGARLRAFEALHSQRRRRRIGAAGADPDGSGSSSDSSDSEGTAEQHYVVQESKAGLLTEPDEGAGEVPRAQRRRLLRQGGASARRAAPQGLERPATRDVLPGHAGWTPVVAPGAQSASTLASAGSAVLLGNSRVGAPPLLVAPSAAPASTHAPAPSDTLAEADKLIAQLSIS